MLSGDVIFSTLIALGSHRNMVQPDKIELVLMVTEPPTFLRRGLKFEVETYFACLAPSARSLARRAFIARIMFARHSADKVLLPGPAFELLV